MIPLCHKFSFVHGNCTIEVVFSLKYPLASNMLVVYREGTSAHVLFCRRALYSSIIAFCQCLSFIAWVKHVGTSREVCEWEAMRDLSLWIPNLALVVIESVFWVLYDDWIREGDTVEDRVTDVVLLGRLSTTVVELIKEKRGEASDVCYLKWKWLSSNKTCCEMKVFCVLGLNHMYPLRMVPYPTNTQGTLCASNLDLI